MEHETYTFEHKHQEDFSKVLINIVAYTYERNNCPMYDLLMIIR